MEHTLAKFGCFFGFLSIFLYYISPLYGSWWFSLGLLGRGLNMLFGGTRLNAFGAVYTDEYNHQILGPIGIIAGFSTLIGSLLLLVGIMRTNKILGIVGGIFIIMGPILFLAALFSPMADPDELKYFMERGILFGGRSTSSAIGDEYYYAMFIWGLGPGFYIALTAGILGTIGAVIISDEENF